jgi:hypothetical protein
MGLSKIDRAVLRRMGLSLLLGLHMPCEICGDEWETPVTCGHCGAKICPCCGSVAPSKIGPTPVGSKGLIFSQ